MKKQISRYIAGILAGSMVVTILPSVPAKAEESYTEVYAYDLNEVKATVLNSEEAARYENGAVTFPLSGTSVDVGSELVYHLFRQGNTDKEQTVTLVTQDYTAGYGTDYELIADGKVIDGKENILMDGSGVTYDVYLDAADEGSRTQETKSETEGDDSKLGVDMEQVKEEASSTFELTFAPKEQVKEIRVRAKVPAKATGNKEFQLMVYEAGDGLAIGKEQVSVITLAETREVEDSSIQLLEDSSKVVDGYVTVMVERNGNTSGYNSYTLEAEDGTAVNGEDYVLKSTELFFTPGVSKQRVHIPLVSAEKEEAKTFTLRAGDSKAEIEYTSTALGAEKRTFAEKRGVVNISMADFEKGDHTGAIDDITFNWEGNKERYEFGAHSKVFNGDDQRNASIRSKTKYDFTSIEKIKISASSEIGTVAGDHLEIYVSNEDYAKNQAKLNSISAPEGRRISAADMRGQQIYEISVNRIGEYYLYMTSDQHSQSGWCYFYLYDQEFNENKANEGHVALYKKKYKLKAVTPDASEFGGVTPAGDVRLTLTSNESVTGRELSTAYRDESFKISYTQSLETAEYAGYQVENTLGEILTTVKDTSEIFQLSSDLLASYGDKFEDDTIVVRPIFRYGETTVEVLKQEFSNAENIKVELDTEKGKVFYTDSGVTIATVTWDPKQTQRETDLVFKVIENDNYTGDYQFAAFKEAHAGSTNAILSNPVYHSTQNREWSIHLEQGYYQITPMISNRQSKLLLNVTGASHGEFTGKAKDFKGDSCTVTELDGKYNTNDIVRFTANPKGGYRAKWTYRDVASGQRKTYYGTRFYYQVQMPMLSTDNHVSLEFESCGTRKKYSVVAEVYMQGGNLLHEPAADTDQYSPLEGANVSLGTESKNSAEDGTAGVFSLQASAGETYTALVVANERQYIQDVVIPEGNVDSVRQKMKLSYYYPGPRVTSLMYYASDGTVQNGDTIFMKDNLDSVVLAAEIEKAGQPVTKVVYKIKHADSNKATEEFEAEHNGNKYIYSMPLGMQAEEGDQIWIELRGEKKQEDSSDISYVSYGEINTGYTIVKAKYTDESDVGYFPDVGWPEEINDVPFFQNIYFLFGIGHVKMPTFSISKSGGITYLTVGVSMGKGTNLLAEHKEGDSYFKSPNTLDVYQKNLQAAMKVIGNSAKTKGSTLKERNNFAQQTLKKASVSFNIAVSGQLALAQLENPKNKTVQWNVVGGYVTLGVSGSFFYNLPFVLYTVPMFVALTITPGLSDTFQIYAKNPDGYVRLEKMHDPSSSSFKPENDARFDLPLSISAGVGVNGILDVAAGGTGRFNARWVNWEWGTVNLTLSIDFKLELLAFGLSHSWNMYNYPIVNSNPYLTAKKAQQEEEVQLMNQSLADAKIKSVESYNQTIGDQSGALVSDAYDFSKPKIYPMGNDKYLIVGTVDGKWADQKNADSDTSSLAEGTTAETENRAVIAYAIYDAKTGTYQKGQSKIFQSLEPSGEAAKHSINFHPSITALGDSGKYLITWNSILYRNSTEALSLANARVVIKSAIYNSNTGKVEAYKSLVSEDDDEKLISSIVLDTAYDADNQEVVVLYRALNQTGMDENSTISDYVKAGTSLMYTSLKVDGTVNDTFADGVEIVSGGRGEDSNKVVKNAELEMMDGTPVIAYQLTEGEQANLLSTGEEGSKNHICLAGLKHKVDGGYKIEKNAEVAEKENSETYQSQPKLISYQTDGTTHNLLMWQTVYGIAAADPLKVLDGTETEATSSGAGGIASIANPGAGSFGDYQIIKGADGKVYSIWSEGTESGSKIMMAALENIGTADHPIVSWGDGSEVLETTDNNYACAMSPVVDSKGRLQLLYRETNIKEGGKNNIRLKTVDLTEEKLTVENYARLTDQEIQNQGKEVGMENLGLQISNLRPKAGETLTIRSLVQNSGVQATKERQLMLYVNDIASGETAVVPALSSGIKCEVEFRYQVPENYDGSPLKFSVKGDLGTEEVQETINGPDIEVSSLRFEELDYLGEDSENINYTAYLTVTNNGNDIADPSTFVLSHVEYSKENDEGALKETDLFGNCDIPMIKPGETKLAKCNVTIPRKYFEENSLHLAAVTGTLYYNYHSEDIDQRRIANVFSDYVQAEETPEAETLTTATTKKVGIGQRLHLKAQVVPVSAQEFAEFSYESSDPSIATVDSNGIVTGLKKGTCTISIMTKNGLKKTTQIQVTKDAAEDGEEEFKPSGDPEQNGKDSNKKNPNVKTGDNSPLLPLVILIIISGAIIGCMIYRKRKTNIN